ncbi:MAG: p-hydroxycinnamoyl CoA hydratase/lyase [Actinobacteria bacterium 21-73-9]|nr:MAG: p-hydroxycinnamoyl CoA hydratase/lyase [Actinobacteria bacterium 21-73-9]
MAQSEATVWTTAKGTVRVEVDNGIGWLSFNRPEKRNAMSPTLNVEMTESLERLEADDRVRVVVLTGAGESWSAGMDLKEYFRDVDQAPPHVQTRVRRESAEWQWRRLINYPKATIAMVNGWCFGGAITPLVCCDLAVRAAEMRLVNEAVPRERLRERTIEVAHKLAAVSPSVMRAAKGGFRKARLMAWDDAEEFLYAKFDQGILADPERSKQRGLEGFLDTKSFRPGLGAQADQARGG